MSAPPPVRFETAPPPREALRALYASVGWTAYLKDPDALERAVAHSTFVVAAWEGARLVGLARAISDESSVWFLQDLLVVPDRQGAGLGSALLERCRTRFADVARGVLLTDAASAGGAGDFYARSGWRAADGLGLVTFIRTR